MTPEERDRRRDVLRRALQREAACVPLERLGESLTSVERAHLETCPRCQTELTLWTEWNASAPGADDEAATRWVASELHRRRPVPSQPDRSTVWAWLRPRGFVAAAATFAMAVAVASLWWDREPDVSRLPNAKQGYRSTVVQVVRPLGDVGSAPRQLQWMAVTAAARYDVQILEVDRTVLWRGSSNRPVLDVPPSVAAQLVPGKTVLWEVTASDTSGTRLAESGMQRFRVVRE